MSDLPTDIEIEEALVEKILVAIDKRNGKRSWFQTNVVAIVTLVVGIAINMIIIGVAWGTLRTQNDHNRVEVLRVESEIKALEVVVRIHHDDYDKHTSKTQMDMIIQKLNSIESKVDQHLRDSALRR